MPGVLSDIFFKASRHSISVKGSSHKGCSSLVKEVEFTTGRTGGYRFFYI